MASHLLHGQDINPGVEQVGQGRPAKIEGESISYIMKRRQQQAGIVSFSRPGWGLHTNVLPRRELAADRFFSQDLRISDLQYNLGL